MIVDIVTNRAADLHRELMSRFVAQTPPPAAEDLYATAYRAVERDGEAALDVWQEPLAVGRPLPTMPLWLRGGLCLPVELEASYERTCREQRIEAATR